MDRKINYSIVLVSLIFSLMAGSGFYGFGPDFYVTYYKSNLTWGNWNDKLGYLISTLNIFGIHWGVYIVSLILAFSTGILLKVFFKKNNKSNIFIFFITYILILHTWPIIMSTSNAMRQGLTMSFVFISLANLIERKIYTSLFLIFISIFFHKSGIFFLVTFFNLIFFSFFLKNTKLSVNVFFILLLTVILLIGSIIFFSILLPNFEPSKIISRDNRYFFILFFLIYISLFFFRIRYSIHNKVNLFLYIFGFATLPMIYIGLNWEYERMMMIVTIPLILFTCELLSTRKMLYLYLMISFITLLSLTVIFDQYDSLS